ncbi:NinG recombination protein [Pseudomonas chlororaphis subsp. piscium]|uniref:recombination protein NinG n=1 Tax=Pseudomonas chlororaphis TaxID=587753 RepID=UPI000F566002|nr:recombination protein NinG [Pseudomonas chlororaphis]AZC52293.1 NinG recombination protein [Pseudomonas chlororaphis subsp. piscium]
MRVAVEKKAPKPKTCKNPACRASFVPSRLGQAVCSPACAIIDAPRNQEKARKSLAQVARREIKVRKERIKTRSDHFRETQAVFNEWVRLRDAALPCVSCGRHHEGQYHAGHYRTVGANPELRFEPLNVHKQCAPCNNHKSGDIVNYRIELVKRIGQDQVEWLEGPHSARKYTADELKALKAKYRELIKELKKGEAA